jgi:hypothetical protein
MQEIAKTDQRRNIMIIAALKLGLKLAEGHQAAKAQAIKDRNRRLARLARHLVAIERG